MVLEVYQSTAAIHSMMRVFHAYVSPNAVKEYAQTNLARRGILSVNGKLRA